MKLTNLFSFLQMLSILLILSCSSKSSQDDFSMDGIAKAYKEKFETEASSVTSKIVSPYKSEVVSTYQGAGMTAFTNLYIVKDSNGSVYTIAYSTHCPRQGNCDLQIEHAKVYDSQWNDVTAKILPLQDVRSKMKEARLRPDYNEKGSEVDGFYLNLPEDESGELTFTLTPTSKYDPNAGNSFFEFSYCRWNPNTTKCETFEKEYEMSP